MGSKLLESDHFRIHYFGVVPKVRDLAEPVLTSLMQSYDV